MRSSKRLGLRCPAVASPRAPDARPHRSALRPRLTRRSLLAVVAIAAALYITGPTVWMPWDGAPYTNLEEFGQSRAGVILRTPHVRLFYVNFDSHWVRGFLVCGEESFANQCAYQ